MTGQTSLTEGDLLLKAIECIDEQQVDRDIFLKLFFVLLLCICFVRI